MFATLGGGECSEPELARRPIMLSTTRTPRPRRMLRARRTARTVLFNRSDWKLGSRLHGRQVLVSRGESWDSYEVGVGVRWCLR